MPDITVIVPVFNTDPYLEGCIDSILSQTFNNFELILVDDGSTDESPHICERKATYDSRIKLLRQTNQGQQAAIMHGLSAACGRWICFVDSDDQLPPDALEKLYFHANDSTDIIVGFSFPGNSIVEVLPIDSWRLKMIQGSVILCTRWGKLYRAFLFDDDVASISHHIRVGEDMIMNIRLAFRSEKPVIIINQQVYHYNRNDGSVSSTYHWNADKYAALYDAVYDAIPPGYKQHGTKSGTCYLHGCVKNAFSMAKGLLTFDTRTNCRTLSCSRLISILQDEVQKTDYKPSFDEYLILHHSSAAFTHWYFVFKRYLTIIVQSAKRRLHI